MIDKITIAIIGAAVGVVGSFLYHFFKWKKTKDKLDKLADFYEDKQ